MVALRSYAEEQPMYGYRIIAAMLKQDEHQILEWLFLVRGAPSCLRGDNGPVFIAFALKQWLHEQHCHALYIKPGSPWENPSIESFNGTFRTECLNRWLFADGQEAQTIIEQWQNTLRHKKRLPHIKASALRLPRTR